MGRAGQGDLARPGVDSRHGDAGAQRDRRRHRRPAPATSPPAWRPRPSWSPARRARGSRTRRQHLHRLRRRAGLPEHGPRLPAAVAAIHEQVDRYLHQCFMVGMYEPYVEVCRRLAELSSCRGGEQKSLPLNSGAEAVENAVKIARAATGRQAVVVFDHAFHGRTLLTMTMTSKVVYKRGFGPFAPEVYRAPGPTPTATSPPTTRSTGSRRSSSPRSIPSGRLRRARARPGRGRVHPDAARLPAAPRAVRPPRDPLRRRRGAERRRADRAGVGDRALRRRARPPRLGQVARRRALRSPASPGGRCRRGRPRRSRRHVRGNPVACAAAVAVLDEVATESFQQRARELGEFIGGARRHRHARRLGGRGPRLGPMLALELVEDRGTKVPAGGSQARPSRPRASAASCSSPAASTGTSSGSSSRW